MTPGKDTPSDAATALADCPYDFLVRAVVTQDAGCPKVEVVYANNGGESVVLRRRDFRPQSGLDEVRVCQARLDGKSRPQTVTFPDEKAIDVASRWNAENGPKRVAAFGDTGCRDDKDQPCNTSDWPLARLTELVLSGPENDPGTPELVIHLGDFMYVKFDAWASWKESFFDPAAPLLSAAPWIMVRGNHERCGEFGDTPHGYYLFFDTGAAKNCENDTNAGDLELTDTYAVDLSQTHRVIVADSAISYALDVEKPKGIESDGSEPTVFVKVKRMLGEVRRLAGNQSDKTIWMTTHVPVFAL